MSLRLPLVSGIRSNENAREWLFRGLLTLELLGFALWQLGHLGGFQWTSDEGTYLMRVALMQRGFDLYREVWTDQLPGLILMLRGVFALLGTSVEVGRGMVVLLALSGLLGTAILTRQLAGRVGALAAIPLLSLIPNVYWLSRAIVSPDLPAISLATVGLAAMGRHTSTQRRVWLVASGLAFGLGLYVKATALLAVVPAAIWLGVDTSRRADRRPASFFVPFLVWGGCITVLLAAGILPFDLRALWDQFVVTQVASAEMELKIASHAAKILSYLTGENVGLTALGVAGIATSLRHRSDAALVGLSWLFFSVIVLLVRSPMWPKHHLVVLLFPLVLLAGKGLSTVWTGLWYRPIRPGQAIVIAAILLYVTVLSSVIAANADLASAPTYKSSLDGVAFLKEALPEGSIVISDYHMIPFRAECIVPPELATVSKKRIQLGLLDADRLVRLCQETNPRAILFWDEQLTRAPEFVDWATSRYPLGFVHGYHSIRVHPSSLPAMATVMAQFGQSLLLEGYALEPRAVDPGGALDLILSWRVLEPISERLYGFAHLVSPDGRQVSQDDHLAWGEAYPSTSWRLDETVADRYHVDVPLGASPGQLLLSVGLYESDGKARLPVVDGQGVRLAGDQLTLGAPLVVRWPPQYEPPRVARPADARFGEIAQLVGHDVKEHDGNLLIRLVWKALSPSPATDLKVFVHLRDGTTIVAQHDGVPGRGDRPTWAWRADEYVEDVHAIDTSTVAVGTYDLYVGMYDRETGVRLPVRHQDDSSLPNDEVPLGSHSLEGLW